MGIRCLCRLRKLLTSNIIFPQNEIKAFRDQVLIRKESLATDIVLKKYVDTICNTICNTIKFYTIVGCHSNQVSSDYYAPQKYVSFLLHKISK